MHSHSEKSKSITGSTPVSRKAGSKGMHLEDNRARSDSSVQRKANTTGLPDNLKSGIENLSGHSMDDVKVHYRSSQPAQLNAHAYAQGNQIHIASGQEKHLPHEAWHVVQQKQGRVKPTMQMKGKVNINDDTGLEKEADVMGAKALGSGGKISQFKNVVQRAGVKQLKVAQLLQVIQRVKGKPPKFVKRTDAQILLATIVAYADKVGPGLEDDDDVEELEDHVAKAKTMEKSIANYEKKKATAPYRTDGTGLRRSVRGKPIVSKTSAKYKEDFQSLIDDRMGVLRRTLSDMKKEFVVHTGGFGAKGRASAMPDAEVLDPMDATAKTLDNSFIENISLGGTPLTSSNKVVKTSLTTGDSVGPLKVKGTGYNETDGVPHNLRQQTDAGITPLSAATWHPVFHGAPQAMDRGTGQYANMNNTNANGYAWLWQVAGWRNQRWEWLHVRGAGLGGATNGTNLVLGTRDANTQMIPFESNVRLLAAEVAKNPKYTGLKVDWSVNNPVGHKVSNIGLDWTLQSANLGVAPNLTGSARFNPLNTTSNISKKEVEHIEEALKTARDTIVP